MSIRSLFWPGFILGLLLMTSISCLGAATVLGVDVSALAEIRPNETPAWVPAPTSIQVPQVEQSPQPSDPIANDYTFQIGDSGQNITTGLVRIRRTPGYRSKPENDIIAQTQPGDVFEIIEGPEEADSLLWWKVRYVTAANATITGWMAEASASGVTIMGR